MTGNKGGVRISQEDGPGSAEVEGWTSDLDKGQMGPGRALEADWQGVSATHQLCELEKAARFPRASISLCEKWVQHPCSCSVFLSSMQAKFPAALCLISQ